MNASDSPYPIQLAAAVDAVFFENEINAAIYDVYADLDVREVQTDVLTNRQPDVSFMEAAEAVNAFFADVPDFLADEDDEGDYELPAPLAEWVDGQIRLLDSEDGDR